MMSIALLPQLETRTEWISFFRREHPCVYIKQPLCLVDFQSTYLQITLLSHTSLDGRHNIKYSLGSQSSMEPAWKLIKGCNWQLSEIVNGLDNLYFGSNVRDNSLQQRHSQLTVRKAYAKDKHLISPALIGPLTPLQHLPDSWNLTLLARLLSHRQYSHITFVPQPDKPPPVRSLLVQLFDSPDSWHLRYEPPYLLLLYHQAEVLKLTPVITPPQPRLADTAR